MLTNLEKLLRLREIHMAIAGPSRKETVDALVLERDTILATVAVPPHHLEGEDNPAAWATEFVKLYPAVDVDLASLWFNGAIHAGAAPGGSDTLERLARMEKLLRLVAKGLDGGQIRTTVAIRDDARPELEPRPLAAVIQDLVGPEEC